MRSYRGSAHEVCLPEYACVTYGWNPASPDLPQLLEAFLRQRYGIASPGPVARSILAESEIVPPSTLAKPSLGHTRRAYILKAKTQMKQLKDVAQTEPRQHLVRIDRWQQMLSQSEGHWKTAQQSATRHQDELEIWLLSRRLLRHRLDLTRMLLHRFAATENLEDGEEWRPQMGALFKERNDLRTAWASFFEDIYTPEYLKVDLYQRFDVEDELVK